MDYDQCVNNFNAIGLERHVFEDYKPFWDKCATYLEWAIHQQHYTQDTKVFVKKHLKDLFNTCNIDLYDRSARALGIIYTMEYLATPVAMAFIARHKRLRKTVACKYIKYANHNIFKYRHWFRMLGRRHPQFLRLVVELDEGIGFQL
jgi:hypothetical protein